MYILLVVYIFREQENVILRDHIQSNIDNFLTKHPNAMVIVTGDFNPTSTGLDPKSVCIPNHLTQLVTFYTRDTGILDWFCTNMPHLFHLQRLPKVATSDHYTILARPLVTPTPKEDSIRRIRIRKCRASNCAQKFEILSQELNSAMDTYFLGDLLRNT